MYWLFKDPVVIMKKSCPDCLRIQLTVAWLNLTMPNQTVKNGLKAKKIKLPKINFFSRKTTNKIFMYILAHFILQNFTKILKSQSKVTRIWPKMAYLSWTNFFWYKPLNNGNNESNDIITFIYLLTLFIVQNFKKSLQQIQS